MVRIRLIVTGAAAASLGLAGLGAPAVAGAKVTPPSAQGQIDRAISTGVVNIKPHLLDAEPFPPGKIKFHGTVSGCTTVGGGAAPFGITGGTIKGTLPITESPCSCEVNDEDVGASFTIKWKGTQKVADTKMSPTRARFSGQLSPSTGIVGFSLVAPGTGPDSTGDSTGSFSASQAQVLPIHFPTDPSVGCSPKNKGVKGSGGLKKVSIGTAAEDGTHSLAQRSSTIRFGMDERGHNADAMPCENRVRTAPARRSGRDGTRLRPTRIGDPMDTDRDRDDDDLSDGLPANDDDGIPSSDLDEDEQEAKDQLEVDQKELEELGLTLDDPHQPDDE